MHAASMEPAFVPADDYAFVHLPGSVASAAAGDDQLWLLTTCQIKQSLTS